MIIEQPHAQIPMQALALPGAAQMAQHIESGKVLYFPNLAFALDPLFSSLDKGLYKKRKNISYNPKDGSIKGLFDEGYYQATQQMMQDYSAFAQQLIAHLFPSYVNNIATGRTSFRPVEVKGRVSSYRKDDTRLHVDAFPSTPMGDARILRVFSNVNPQQQSRVWRLGEPFEEVVSQFFPKLRKPCWGERKLLNMLHLTKKERSVYDHYMLQLHNTMKYDLTYQQNAKQQTVPFAAGFTWVVYSD